MHIGHGAFSGQHYYLESVYTYNPIPLDLGVDPVFDTYMVNLYVPVGSKERYQQADGWKDFYRIIEKGDLDGDGQLTVNDITMLVSLYLDNGTAENADMDGDGQITVNDITVLNNLYLDSNE